jgi:hypothetical protein
VWHTPLIVLSRKVTEQVSPSFDEAHAVKASGGGFGGDPLGGSANAELASGASETAATTSEATCATSFFFMKLTMTGDH